MNAQEIISSGILELYSSGLTSEAESAEVERWCREFTEVRAELESIQLGLEQYAKAYAVAPAAGVKNRVFSSIQFETAVQDESPKQSAPVPAKVFGISAFWKYAAAASIALLIGSLILNYTYYNKYAEANSELAATANELQQQREIANTMKEDMGVIANKNAMPVSLAGLPDVADAAARIYWMKNTGEVYIDPSNLPVPPAGKQYQFWAIVDGKPVSGGMIETETGNKTIKIQKMKSFGNAQAFAVSLEDAGPEAPAPTKVMVMGSI